MESVEHTEQFLERLRHEFPKFRVVDKRGSPLCRTIHHVLFIVTCGRQRSFLDGYHTVLGQTLYVAESFATMSEPERLILLRHERVHLRQARRLGFPLFAFLYLVPFLPMGLSWGRARLEWEAYRETLLATRELLGHKAAADPALRARIVARFTGPDYGWMWPFQRMVSSWYDQALAEVLGREPGAGEPRGDRCRG